MINNDGILRICICGTLRSGKDTVGALLSVKHGFATPIAFGDALKDVAHRAFPDVPREPKPRALYQFMNVMRDYDADVWIKHVARKVDWALESRATKGIVISDARQPNEIDWARANGFTIVRVTASDAVRIARAERAGDAFTYEDLTHPTEQYIGGFNVDYEIRNDGSYDDLVAGVERLVAEITHAHPTTLGKR